MQLRALIFSLLSLASVALAVPAPAPPNSQLPLVESNKLRRVLTRTNLLKHAAKLQDFADVDPAGNRAFGGKGHKLTVDYIYEHFKHMSDYYTVEKQEFTFMYAHGSGTFSVEGNTYDTQYFTYSPGTNGALTLELANTLNLGCTAEDFPTSVSGKIALVSRGTCDFGTKALNAAKAGAKAIIIYNNQPGSISGGTFGAPTRPEGPYAPGLMVTQDVGNSLKADIMAGKVLGTVKIDAVIENRVTHNVIAQSKVGDPNNVIVSGGHTDSVGGGAGINDNGSGTIGILEVARQLRAYRVNNAVRFCFWSAEEYGLVGSEYYVEHLSAAERNKIRLYLNFDMIASPNYVYFVYDGDGSAFNKSGPRGSAEIEHMFEEHFLDVGWQAAPTEFSGRSDYGPFMAVDIPCGGLFTGAEGVKTPAQASYFGGTAGDWYDENYHKIGDTIKNLNLDAFITNVKAIAHSVATYAISTDDIPRRAPAVAPKDKREELFTPEQKIHAAHSRCGHEEETM